MNGNNKGAIVAAIKPPAQVEHIREDALKLPWRQYLKLVQLNAIGVTAIFVICALIGPPVKAVALGALLASGTLYFIWGAHDEEQRMLVAVGALLYVAADVAAVIYFPLLMVIEVPIVFLARLYGILVVGGFLWPIPLIRARYEQEIVDPKYTPPRQAIPGEWGPMAPERVRRRLGWDDLPMPKNRYGEQSLEVLEREVIRPLLVHGNARMNLIRSVTTADGRHVSMVDLREILDAQPSAGFALPKWTTRGWSRQRWDAALTVLEEAGLIHPRTPRQAAEMIAWVDREPGESPNAYEKTLARLTVDETRRALGTL